MASFGILFAGSLGGNNVVVRWIINDFGYSVASNLNIIQ